MGLKLSYEIWGDGAAEVLLLHGFTGNRSAWDHLRPKFGPMVRALAVDLPGHGQSTLPDGMGRSGFEETVDALSELVGKTAQSAVDVIGYSQGARLAIGLAVRWPLRVRRLVLESSAPGLTGRKQRSERQREDAALAIRIREQGIKSFVDEWERRPLFEGLRRLPDPMARALRARRLSNKAEGLASALLSLSIGVQPNYWPLLPILRAPTLLLSGARDAKFTQIARQMAAQLPLGWVRVFEGSGHAPHLEVPEAYADEVLAFLETPWFDAPCAPSNELEERT